MNAVSEELKAETWIFGEVGQAFYHRKYKYFKVSIRYNKPQPCQAHEMNILYDACAAPTAYLPYAVPQKQLLEILHTEYEKHTIFEFLLDAMDSTLGVDLQNEMLRDVEETCEQNEEVYQFVRQRFLSKPLPKNVDVDSAIRLARTDKVRELYLAAKEIKEPVDNHEASE